eukprot:s5458_g2.t1
MEEKALWQYTRYVYSNQVDTYLFDQLLSGIAERVEEQWQISISPDDLDLRYTENQDLEVFQVKPDQPFGIFDTYWMNIAHSGKLTNLVLPPYTVSIFVMDSISMMVSLFCVI